MDCNAAGAVTREREIRGPEGVLVLPVPPSANRYWRTTVATTRLGKGYVKTYVTREADEYREGVRARALVAGFRPLEGDVAVTIRWYRKAKRGDLDNRVKVTLDALQGAAYHTDAQVAELHVVRFEESLNPRLEVEVVPVQAVLARIGGDAP